ncbi:MAG TPA: MFS transporter, partial [Acetobacteraceae bacterium]|nr:MFS transporter [Acetobacteraceae bacterium]
PVNMSVALTSYLLSLTVFIPASGWVADRFGSRTVFRVAILIFTLGSILCGRAGSLWFLVFARIIQGIGGAMMVPVGRLVLLRTVPKSELVSAMAWFTTPALIGPVLGPPVGGFIVTYVSWHWIFDINVPIGALGIVLVSLYIEEIEDAPPGKFDWTGLVLTAVSLVCLMYGLQIASKGVLPWPESAGMLAVGAVAGIAYYLHTRVTEHPIVDLSLMRIPTFGLSVTAASFFRIGIGALPFLLPLMLQVGFGMSAAQSGMITFASSAGSLVMKPGAQYALRKFGFRSTLVFNGALSVTTIALCAGFRPSWPLACIYAVLLAGGFVRSLQFTGFNTIAFADIPPSKMSSATSFYSTAQQLSMTLGVAAGATALEMSAMLLGHPEPLLVDYSAAFLTVALAAAISVPVSMRLAEDAGDELTGHGAAAD